MNLQIIFINPERRMLRSGWRVVAFSLILVAGLIPLVGLLGVILAMLGQLKLATGDSPTPLAQFLNSALLMLAILIATAVCRRFFDRLPFRWFGYQLHPGWWRDYLIGTGLAAAMITVIVAIEAAIGALSLDWSQMPINDLLASLAVSLLFFHFAGAAEELLLRGYPLQTLLRDIHPAWAVMITSTIFGLLHAGNPNASALTVLNTVLAGLWLAVAYLKTRSLWLCTSLHWSWNWMMNAVYGLSVSGLPGIVKGSLFDAHQTGAAWLTGGSYGPEGGLLTTVILITGTLLLWRAGWLSSTQEAIDRLQPAHSLRAPPLGSSPAQSTEESRADGLRSDG